MPGIRYVIDPGTARISRYSARIEDPAAADRSRSRRPRPTSAGPLRPRGAGHLHPPVQRRGLPAPATASPPPEIQRTNLAAVILQTKALRLGDIERFPFLDPPRAEAIRDGYRTLFELGALDEDQRTDRDRPAAGPAAGRPADRADDPGGRRKRTAWPKC